MLAPLPVIFSARVSPLRRLILIMLLCSGSLVMVAAILRAYYSLQTIRYMAIATGWSSRELFVAAIVTSMPGIKPLFSSSRWVTAKSQPYHQELVTVGGSGGSRQRGKSLPSRNNDDVSTEDLIVTKIDSGKMGKESQ